MNKKFYYCEKCGSCLANEEQDPRTSMSCPFCENGMTDKGLFDWASTAQADRDNILKKWHDEAAQAGIMNEELYAARKHNSHPNEKKDVAPKKQEGLERIGPILRKSARGIGFIGVILFLVSGICLAVFASTTELMITGIAVAVIGSFVSLVSILVLYALGELIVRTGEVSMNTR